MRLAPILLCALLAFAGCGDDDASPPDAGPPDAGPGDAGPGTDAGPDRWAIPDASRPDIGDCPARPPAPRGVDEQPGSAVLGAVPAPIRLRLGFAFDPATSISAVWQTDDGTLVSDLEIGLAADALTTRLSGVTLGYQPVDRTEDPVRLHQLDVCGLSAGTSYFYRVGGEGAWSDVSSFTTAPAADAADRSIVVGVTGDSRNDPSVFGRIQDDMASEAVDLQLFTGDVVEISIVQTQWHDWFDAAGTHLATAPFMPSNGNHDGLSVNYLAQFAMPVNEKFFAFEYGPLYVVILDSDDKGAEQVAFLEWALGRVDRVRTPWVVAVHHRPIWSQSNHSSDTELQSLWMPLYERLGVDLVLTGHDHNYQRTHPLVDGARVADGEGVVYVVTGGSGAPLYGVDPAAVMAVQEETNHYVLLRVSPTELELIARYVDGTMLDTLTLVR